MHQGDRPVDDASARTLLRAQFPDWAGLPLRGGEGAGMPRGNAPPDQHCAAQDLDGFLTALRPEDATRTMAFRREVAVIPCCRATNPALREATWQTPARVLSGGPL